jgi:hypothetical protein
MVSRPVSPSDVDRPPFTPAEHVAGRVLFAGPALILHETRFGQPAWLCIPSWLMRRNGG